MIWNFWLLENLKVIPGHEVKCWSTLKKKEKIGILRYSKVSSITQSRKRNHDKKTSIPLQLWPLQILMRNTWNIKRKKDHAYFLVPLNTLHVDVSKFLMWIWKELFLKTVGSAIFVLKQVTWLQNVLLITHVKNVKDNKIFPFVWNIRRTQLKSNIWSRSKFE